jgi:hypothetical protein
LEGEWQGTTSLLLRFIDDRPPHPRLQRSLASVCVPRAEHGREPFLDCVVRPLLFPRNQAGNAEEAAVALSVQHFEALDGFGVLPHVSN